MLTICQCVNCVELLGKHVLRYSKAMVAVSIRKHQGTEKNHVQPDLSALNYVFYAEKEKKIRRGLKKQFPWATVL